MITIFPSFKFILHRNLYPLTYSPNNNPNLKIHNYDQAYFLLSTPHNPSYKSLVFLQPIFSKKGNSLAAVKNLKNRNVYCFQMMNHYDKSRYFDYMDYNTVTEDVNNIVEYIGLKQFTLIGNCLGANIAGQYASRYPQKVQNLILWQIPTPYIINNFKIIAQSMKKFEQSMPNKKDIDQKLLKALPTVQSSTYDLKDISKYLIQALKTYDEVHDRFGWKVNFKAIYESLQRIHKYSNIGFEGNVIIMNPGKRQDIFMQYIDIKFPKINKEKDIYIFEHLRHESLTDPIQSKELSQFINKYLQQFDRKQK